VVAVHHLHLDTLLRSHSGSACAMGQHWIGLSNSCGKCKPRWLRWYGVGFIYGQQHV